MKKNYEHTGYSVTHIANFFIEESKEEGSFNLLSGNKILYFSFGWVSYFLNKYLFNDRIEAWQYGPVIPTFYHECKSYGREPINKKIIEIAADKPTISLDEIEIITPEIKDSDTELKEVLRKIWIAYKDFSPTDLINITHARGTPWSLVYDGSHNKEIPKELIAEYFEAINTN